MFVHTIIGNGKLGKILRGLYMPLIIMEAKELSEQEKDDLITKFNEVALEVTGSKQRFLFTLFENKN